MSFVNALFNRIGNGRYLIWYLAVRVFSLAPPAA